MRFAERVGCFVFHLLPEGELVHPQAHDFGAVKSVVLAVIINDARVFRRQARAVSMVGEVFALASLSARWFVV